MSKIETDRDAEKGNTKKSLSQQKNQLKRWFFTFNNYEPSYIEILETKFKSICEKYIFQEEIGEEGTPHLQGAIWLLKPMRWTEFKLNKKIHWETLISEDGSEKYCQKEETRNGKCYKWGWPVEIKTLKREQLRPFQKWLEDYILGEVNENKVLWIADFKGQLGKTELLRYLNVKYGIPFAYGGKCSDIINLAFNNQKYLLTNERPCFIYNISREDSNDNKNISYSSMEQISDGCIANTKFEAGCFVFNKPHVIVLSNCLPETKNMTKKRWIVKTINDKFEMSDYIKLKDKKEDKEEEEDPIEYKPIKKIKKIINSKDTNFSLIEL